MRLNTFLLTVGLALFASLDLSAQTVRVIFVSGQAELQRPDEPAAHPVQKGESVIIGTRISTGADGRVVLTPMPGVKSMIAPNTIVVLESASDSHPSADEVKHQATLDLKVGAVVSDLQKQPGASFDYSIRTPRGLAGARGTTFTVGLNAAGIQTIVVEHGTISLTLADGRTISLTIGQASITQSGGETEHSGKISELSPEDQTLAQNWMKTTLETLASAVDAGIQLQPDALSNALETAKSLGIPIPPELQQRVENLIANPPSPSTTTTTTSNSTTTDILKSSTTIVTPPNLTADQLAIFLNLSPAAQAAILNLNDPDVTTVALTPDTDTGLPLTDSDIILHLNALNALKKSDPASYALFKQLAGAPTNVTASLPRNANGGTSLPYIDGAPDPTQWSLAAFGRALAMWNSTAPDCLNYLQKQQIISLNAGEIIMDRSSSYISALLDAYGALSPTDQTNLKNAGWGKYLSELANNPTNMGLTSALSAISSYDPAQITALKDFGISPQDVASNSAKIGDLLTALNGLGSDETTIRQLVSGGSLLQAYNYYDGSGSEFAGYLSNSVLGYYNASTNGIPNLTDSEKTAIRALGVGAYLLYNSPTNFAGYGPNETYISVGDRIKELADFYNSRPSADQQALRDMGLFEGYDPYGNDYGSNLINGDTLNTDLLAATISTYKALPQLTKSYLAAEAKSYSFLQIYLLTTNSGNTLDSPYQLRSFADINALLSGLSSAEYSALLDIDAAKAIFEKYHLGDNSETPGVATAVTNLKTFLDFYNTDLGSSQKSTLRELGIVGDGGIAFLGSDPADHTGLGRLLTAYSGLSGSLRASTERLDENSAYGSHFGNSQEIKDRSYFFPYGENQTTLQYISFEAAGNLYVGATKYLVIDDTYDSNVTFTAAYQGDIALRASNLIDLTSTTFASGVRTITMEAATINLTNIDFPGGAGVYLNSLYGGTSNGTASYGDQNNNKGAYPNFGSSAYGRVNFISGVKYNGNSVNSVQDFNANGTDIHIGTLTNPVTPTTNPPPSRPL